MNQVDPIQRELINSALDTIANNMMVSVVRTARSNVVKQNMDFSAGILDADANLIAQGVSLPIHLGTMSPALLAVIARFKDKGIKPEDIFINNDPYEGASHLNDLFMFKPIFFGAELVAYVCIILHYTDMGGRVPGGNATDSMEIFQEGFRIPPVRLYDGGILNETFTTIFEKQVRVPDIVMADLWAQVSSVNAAEKEFHLLLGRHPPEHLRGYMTSLLDYAEQLTRKSIRELPDTDVSFEDFMDDDGTGVGPVKIRARVIKSGDEVIVDYTGTSPQTGGAINPNFAATMACTWAVLRTVLSNDIPNNAGFCRAIKVTAPEGCFVNPKFPAAFGARGAAGYRLRHVVLGAMARWLPNVIPACPGGAEFAIAISGFRDAERSQDSRYLILEFHNSTGVGGWPDEDGQDGGPSPVATLGNTPIELIEADGPVLVEEYALLPDTEGAGQYRGSLGVVRSYRVLGDNVTVQVRSDREFNAPWGTQGGHAGAGQRIYRNGKGETVNRMPSKFVTVFKSGETLRVEMPGSGGYGDPLKRCYDAVREDVVQGKLSAERARKVYGHVELGIDQDLNIRQAAKV